jgi:type III pantothenate kinase
VDLLVDIGNTSIKWTTCDKGVMGAVSSVRHESFGSRGLDELWSGLPRPGRLRISNVGGTLIERTVRAAAQRLWQSAPLFAATQKRAYGVTIAYDNPQRLGVDRWLALVAAYNGGMCPAIVADCGTAVTLDVIDDSGRHRGGLIVPGLRLMWEALVRGTHIPAVPYETRNDLLGSDTTECIGGGALQAVSGMIERVQRRLERNSGVKPRIVLSGSDAHGIREQLDYVADMEPHLVLKGLSVLQD